MTVSLCMIVRDEEANLDACLASVRGLTDEIVVVDTGSVDRTKQIAAAHGARVFDFPWCDDFAAARNASIRHATGDWIFWMDADDRVDTANRERLAALFARLGDDPDGYVMRCESVGDSQLTTEHVTHLRLFRRYPQIRFDYRVHEQVAPAVRRAGGRLHEVGITVRHEGYVDAGTTQKKRLRNLRLLERECADRPLDAFVLYYRGATLLELDRVPEAIVSLELALGVVPRGTMVARLVPLRLAWAYERAGLIADAARTIEAACRVHPSDLDLAHTWARLLFRSGKLLAADALVSSVTGPAGAPPPEHPSPSWCGLRQLRGCARYVEGRFAEAELDAQGIVSACPAFGPAWLLLADALLAQRRMADLDALVAVLEREPGTEVARALIAASRRALLGDPETGRQLVARALGHHGSHPFLTRAAARLAGRDAARWRYSASLLSAADLPGDLVVQHGRVDEASLT